MNNTYLYDSKHPKGRSKAYLALATCYDKLENVDKAVEFLEKYSETVKENQDLDGEAKACDKLGTLYCQSGNFPEAIKQYERYYELATVINRISLIEDAKVKLGISKQGAIMPNMVTLLSQPDKEALTAILKWKASLIKLPEGLNA